jgi:hypothetical protein
MLLGHFGRKRLSKTRMTATVKGQVKNDNAPLFRKNATELPGMNDNDLTGSPAIPFVLKDAYGHPHSFDQYQGRWLLLVFLRHLG